MSLLSRSSLVVGFRSLQHLQPKSPCSRSRLSEAIARHECLLWIANNRFFWCFLVASCCILFFHFSFSPAKVLCKVYDALGAANDAVKEPSNSGGSSGVEKPCMWHHSLGTKPCAPLSSLSLSLYAQVKPVRNEVWVLHAAVVFHVCPSNSNPLRYDCRASWWYTLLHDNCIDNWPWQLEWCSNILLCPPLVWHGLLLTSLDTFDTWHHQNLQPAKNLKILEWFKVCVFRGQAEYFAPSASPVRTRYLAENTRSTEAKSQCAFPAEIQRRPQKHARKVEKDLFFNKKYLYNLKANSEKVQRTNNLRNMVNIHSRKKFQRTAWGLTLSSFEIWLTSDFH